MSNATNSTGGGHVLCRFQATNRAPCQALADARSSHGYCFAHEEIYFHDCAVAYRRKARRDASSADRWATALGLDVERLHATVKVLGEHERAIAIDVQ